MRSLANLLAVAVKRSAFELTLESGQPVVYTTSRGTEAESEELPGSELFDMIVNAVDESQQVELAVGNPVEFELALEGGKWTVFAEPGMEGMRVRARREGGAQGPGPAAGLDIELDYNLDGGIGGGPMPLDDFGGAPAQDFSDDLGSGPMLDISDNGPFSLEDSDPSLVSGAPGLHEDEISFSSPKATASSNAPFESGTWALDDDEEFDVGGSLPDEDSLPVGFDAPEYADDYGGHIGVPADDDDEEFDPFSAPERPKSPPEMSEEDLRRRRTLSPTVRAMDASSPAPRDLRRAPTESALRVDPALTATQSSMRALEASERSFAKPRSQGGDTSRELEPVGQEFDFAGIAADIGEGTLAFVREPGLADRIASCYRVRALVFDDRAALEEVSEQLRSAPPGTLVIVRREDPSALLGWILRRLEEGMRVFVETRARSKEGARRMLLGLHAGERAEQWLDCHTLVAVEPGAEGPRVVRV